jgi:ABC-2 type transport system ATP-binding protein
VLSENVLEVENLRKAYKSSKGERISVVNDISFKVKRGEILALLGPNGAGKTTTIKMLSGLLIPSTGIVRINDIDPYKGREALKHIGSVLEGNRNLYWRLTSFENLVYFGVLKGMKYKKAKSRASILLDQFDLNAKAKEQVRNLSRGMQQRLAIAVALMHEPKLLLLDEPGLGLDAKSIIEVKAMIREMLSLGVGILLTTHQFDIAEELADRVAIIDKGVIINEARTEDLLRKYAQNSYEIELLDSLDAEAHKKLSSLPFDVTYLDNRITAECPPENLYQVFDIIRPLCLHRVRRLESDLSSVFLRLTGSKLVQGELS